MRIAAILGTLALIGTLSSAEASEKIRLSFQGKERSYLLHVPSGAPRPLPLVLVFHGGTMTSTQTEKMTGFDELASREKFIVAYPQGIDKRWADGRGTTDPEKQGIDDVGFARAIVKDVMSKHAVDPKRIFATGASNGAIFSMRLACEAADVFAAVAPVIGAIATNLVPRCKPASAISVIGIQSTTDPLIPFDGGEEGGKKHQGAGGRVEGARATQEFWRKVDGCGADVDEKALAPRVEDGTSVVSREYRGCRQSSAVIWYEIHGGGHRWPGRKSGPVMELVVRKVLGKASMNLDGTAVIWEFFRGHPKP